MVLDSQLLTKVFERVIVKLFTIVKDEDPRDPELEDDVLLDEATDIFLRDSC